MPIVPEKGLSETIPRVELIRIYDLLPHEEVIEEKLNELTISILSSGIIKRPILVDKNTNVILDGHHRYVFLKRLGMVLAPVYRVDYMSPNIKVDVWIRYIKGVTSSKIHDIIKSFGAEKNSNPTGIIFKIDDEIYSVEGNRIELYFLLKEIEKELRKADAIINYSPCILDERFLIIPPKLRKSDVISVALKKKPLPPKSTRHIIKESPIIRVPIIALKKFYNLGAIVKASYAID